jgi:uncharacterized protein YneF (UPF0154 family)
MEVKLYVAIIIGVVALLVGAIVGLLVSRKLFQKELEKNPPVTRNMIRTMYMQMGRKPSEKDINRVMETMNVKQPSPKKEKKNSKNDK